MVKFYATQCLILIVTVLLSLNSASGLSDEPTRCFLIGNSLTWDTVPSKLDGDTKWHVDCGKSLPYIVQHPEEPCVSTSTLWPLALRETQFDVISLQVHYGSTLSEDVAAITRLIENQPHATVVIHTGWARSAQRVVEWTQQDLDVDKASLPMNHNLSYIDTLMATLRVKHRTRTFTRTKAMDVLQQVESDITAGVAPLTDVTELYRDKIHMNVVTGRYLMHNAMRHALGQPRSSDGFEALEPAVKLYLDSVLTRVLK